MDEEAPIVGVAKAIGIDARMIRKYIEWGTLTAPDEYEMMNIHRAKCEYYLGTNPNRRRRSLEDLGLTKGDIEDFKAEKRASAAAASTPSETAPGGSLPSGVAIADENHPALSLNDIRARHELLRSQVVEVKLQVHKGELISRREVEMAAAAAGKVLQRALLGLPELLLPYLENKRDMPIIKDRIREMITELQENLRSVTINDEST